MNEIFSNRYRLQKLAIAILLMMGLCVHTHIAGSLHAHQQFIIFEKCLKNPTSCVNNPLAMRVRIRHSLGVSFVAYPKIHGKYQLEYQVPLSGDLTGVQHENVIDILGAYLPDGTFNVIKFQRDNWIRPVKYSVSLLGLTLSIILFYRRYRFSSSRLLPLINR